MSRLTPKMIEFTTNLLEQLGFDLDEYNFDSMGFDQVGELIDTKTNTVHRKIPASPGH